MARAPASDRLRHMLDAKSLTAGKTFDDDAADWVTRDAVERNLERVSEASRHVPSELKAKHERTPWRAIAGLGNVLRHDYPRVGHPRVWEIVTKDLAPLKTVIESILQDLEGTKGPMPDAFTIPNLVLSGDDRPEARSRLG